MKYIDLTVKPAEVPVWHLDSKNRPVKIDFPAYREPVVRRVN